MRFKYQARNGEGEIVKGEIESADEAGAILALRDNGLFISKIDSENGRKSVFSFLSGKTSLKDKIILTQQLAVMIKSGLSVVDALDALKGEVSNKKFAKEIGEIINDVKGGTQLSDAMAKFPDSFSEVYVNTVKSGEKSGKLDSVLDGLTVQLEKDYEISSKLRGAMVYPIFVMITLIVVMAVILIVIIPQLKLIFDDAGAPLPALTRAIVAISFFLKNNIIWIVIGIAILSVLISYFAKTKEGRHLFDSMKLHIPVLGNLFKKTYMAKFTRTFAGLTSAGLPLLDIFETSKRVIGNVLYEEELDRMIKKVEVGQSVSKVLKESKLFPAIIGQLASVGEKSGSMDKVFESMANFFDKDVENITNNLSTLLEPILMIVMGAGIGLIIMSVLQPIYGLVNVM
ncbi:MAG: type II secretion system F family protein [Patescibacteria group bacterium]